MRVNVSLTEFTAEQHDNTETVLSVVHKGCLHFHLICCANACMANAEQILHEGKMKQAQQRTQLYLAERDSLSNVTLALV